MNECLKWSKRLKLIFDWLVDLFSPRENMGKRGNENERIYPESRKLETGKIVSFGGFFSILGKVN